MRNWRSKVGSCGQCCPRAKLRGQAPVQTVYTNRFLIKQLWRPLDSYHVRKLKTTALCLIENKLKKTNIQENLASDSGCRVCTWEYARLLPQHRGSDLRWKDFLCHSNPHRQLGPCDYSRPLPSTHLFECRAFLIHPKKGFKRGLCHW